MMLPSNSMIGAISDALALAETPNTLAQAIAAADKTETTRFEILFKDWLLI
jgi:hypothetical protein